jgi:hypothetical protein
MVGFVFLRHAKLVGKEDANFLAPPLIYNLNFFIRCNARFKNKLKTDGKDDLSRANSRPEPAGKPCHANNDPWHRQISRRYRARNDLLCADSMPLCSCDGPVAADLFAHI